MANSPPSTSPGAFLSTLDAADRIVLMSLGHRRGYRRGAPLVIQGDHNDVALLLLRGRVKVTVGTVDGEEIVLSVLGPGDLVGEFEALDNDGRPRTASAIALDPVECRILTGNEFRAFLETRPGAVRALLRVIIDRLRAADRRRVDSGSLDTAHRLSRLFVEIVARKDPDGRHPVDLDIPLTQHELATMIATSRESVVRALGTMRARGLISTAPRKITICDLEGLRRYAG
jgi:CRP/FNR family transcriptional regulator, cyclic AMP receptor protein